MNIKKYFLLTLFGSEMAQAGTISINFVDASGVDDMLAADIAGWPDLAGTHVANWKRAGRDDGGGDGLPDGVEDPGKATSELSQPGTDPNKKYADGDTVDDATEVLFGSNPKVNTSVPTLSAAATDLLAYWPFDDNSQPATTLDTRHGIPASCPTPPPSPLTVKATAASRGTGPSISGRPRPEKR
ncbi:MAG: hypothetical protein V4726_18160 [Verrucomicrobiota bacterium]